MPGFLYSYEKFRKEIELPAVQYGNSEAMERLQKMIRPFVLRRLKKDVLKDLPDKLEKDMFSPLESEQKELYEAHTERLRLMLSMQTDAEFKTSKLRSFRRSQGFVSSAVIRGLYMKIIREIPPSWICVWSWCRML